MQHILLLYLLKCFHLKKYWLETILERFPPQIMFICKFFILHDWKRQFVVLFFQEYKNITTLFENLMVKNFSASYFGRIINQFFICIMPQNLILIRISWSVFLFTYNLCSTSNHNSFKTFPILLSLIERLNVSFLS